MEQNKTKRRASITKYSPDGSKTTRKTVLTRDELYEAIQAIYPWNDAIICEDAEIYVRVWNTKEERDGGEAPAAYDFTIKPLE